MLYRLFRCSTGTMNFNLTPRPIFQMSFLCFLFAGTVGRVLVNVGDKVEADDLLFEIIPQK
jgi:predicted deacylase